MQLRIDKIPFIKTKHKKINTNTHIAKDKAPEIKIPYAKLILYLRTKTDDDLEK